jgi:hypothetical protein
MKGTTGEGNGETVSVEVKLIVITTNADDAIGKIGSGVIRIVWSNLQLSQTIKPKHSIRSRVVDAVQKLELNGVSWEIEDNATQVWAEAAQQN